MEFLSIVGTRPQFVKLAPIHAAIRRRGHSHTIVDTGQHYDSALRDGFLADLDLRVDFSLDVGPGDPVAQISTMIESINSVVSGLAPDWTIVYGDTNSTLAAALVSMRRGMRSVHLEAGLRSRNWLMPEEQNRLLVDRAVEIRLCPSATAKENLEKENLGIGSYVVGDVMIDACVEAARACNGTPPTQIPQASGEYYLATIHRPYNTDDPDRLEAVIRALSRCDRPVYLAAHPRLRARAGTHGIALETGAVKPIEPLSYRDLIAATMQARSVVTDSGGLQKEAHVLGVPCVTIRSETEWVETLRDGWNVLCYEDLAQVPSLAARTPPSAERSFPYGDGTASDTIVKLLETL